MKINLTFPESNSVLQFAAQELMYYLSKIDGGCSVTCNEVSSNDSIVLCTQPSLEEYGLPKTASCNLDDQYSIQIRSAAGFICGSNSRSVLLGVYKLLELLGCRFLRPGRQYEYIPQLSLHGMTVSANEAASLRHRGICIEGSDSLENILDFIDWMPKLGYNSFFVQFKTPYPFLRQWYEHTQNPLLPCEPFSQETAQELSDKVDAAIQQRGLLHHRVGHGWTSEVLGYPVLGWLPGKSAIPEEKKAFVAQVNGKRDLFRGIPINTNLCFSNPEAFRAMTETVVLYAQEHPEVDFLHVWLADDCNNICECEKCRTENPTDQYIRLLNSIDARLMEEGLSTRICFLLYHELLWPSIKEKLNNPSRFLMMFAPISRTFEKSYAQRDALPPLPKYCRNQVVLPHSLEENLSYLVEWQQNCTVESFVYDYPLGRAHYGDLGYYAISKIIAQDVKELQALKLNGYISCQELRAFLPNALPNYVMGKFLWNTALSFEKTVQDYFEHAYGNNWQDCLSYLKELSALSSCDYFNRIGPRKNPKKQKEYEKISRTVEQFLPVIQRNLEQASGVQKNFWIHLDYHAQYSKLLSKALSKLAGGQSEEAQHCWLEFIGYIRANESSFQGCLDVYRVTEVSTNYTGFAPDVAQTAKGAE